MPVDCIHQRRSDDLPCLTGPADARRMVLLLPLLIAACARPGTATDQQARYGAMDQQARYGAMVGRSEADLTQSFGLPTRRENIEGHAFLIYEQSDVWSGNGSGTRSRPQGLGRNGSGAVAFECRATFVVVAGVISAYSLSGSGC
jgi:hypothetical protein